MQRTDPDEGRWTMRYSRAGHLPPLLARGGDVIQLAEASGAMIGFGPGLAPRATAEAPASAIALCHSCAAACGRRRLALI